MTQGTSTLLPWDERDLAALLTLDEVSPGTYRNRHGDPNRNGRSYGGQLLGQAMMAACRTAAPDRGASMMQMLFLQGAIPDQPIDFHVTPVQDGKRFASRHVTATQAGGRRILDAQVSFAVRLEAPAHQATSRTGGPPQNLPGLSDLSELWKERLQLISGYTLLAKPCMDFRFPDIGTQFGPGAGDSSIRFWLKAKDPLPQGANLHTAAFAYLSDWWLNFSAMKAHLHALAPGRTIYTSSLNHCIWLHHAPRADAWMHFDCQSPVAVDGRGLGIARIHDEEGRLVASATQECLMGYADR